MCLTPLEEAKSIRKNLNPDGKLDLVAIGNAIGKSKKWVWERMTLLEAPKPVQKAVDKGKLGQRSAANKNFGQVCYLLITATLVEAYSNIR